MKNITFIENFKAKNKKMQIFYQITYFKATPFYRNIIYTSRLGISNLTKIV